MTELNLDLDLREGWVEAELAEEFPELGLTYCPLEAVPGSSPRSVKRRLHRLADRYTGSKVVHMRQDPVPWAYRVFARQVGIDPDTDHTPVERVALERLKRGGLPSANIVDDAITIAVAETGVPVLVFDGDRVGASIGLRLAVSGERLADQRLLSAGQLVVADENRPLALVLGGAGESSGVTEATRRMVIGALAVKGVPRISVEEALWTAAETLLAGA
jgi:DNA/RNA-binding domain of Phe-tRNA-synthetase-like protein